MDMHSVTHQYKTDCLFLFNDVRLPPVPRNEFEVIEKLRKWENKKRSLHLNTKPEEKFLLNGTRRE